MSDTKKILPFVGIVYDDQCKALRFYYGLHTQCPNKRPKKGGDYCAVCKKHVEKSIDQKPPFGNIDDRMATGILDYIDPKGKRTLPYYKVLKRMKITKEEALQAAKDQNIIIPDIHWDEQKPQQKPQQKKRGRPIKEVNIINECDIITPSELDKTCSVLEHNNHEYLWCKSTNEVFDIDTEQLIGMYKNNIMTVH